MNIVARYAIYLSALLLTLSSLAAGQRTAQTPEKQAAAELKKLLDLRARLDKIPFNGENKEPHKSFIKANERKIVYNEPAGRWIVQSEAFWTLRDKYKNLKIADDIAWEAAQNPIPGECEGFMTCGINYYQITTVKYLSYYPAGKHSQKALAELKEGFASYADASQADVSYTPPEDPADRAELQKMLKEINAVLAKIPASGAAEIRASIKTLAERYK